MSRAPRSRIGLSRRSQIGISPPSFLFFFISRFFYWADTRYIPRIGRQRLWNATGVSRTRLVRGLSSRAKLWNRRASSGTARARPGIPRRRALSPLYSGGDQSASSFLEAFCLFRRRCLPPPRFGFALRAASPALYTRSEFFFPLFSSSSFLFSRRPFFPPFLLLFFFLSFLPPYFRHRRPMSRTRSRDHRSSRKRG